MLEKYYRIKKVTGVSISIQLDGSASINLCNVSVDNSQLEIGQKKIDIINFEALRTLLPAKAFIALNISGKGVLIKKIESTETLNTRNFHKVLPNANIEDFYIQNFLSGDKSFVSVIRKTDADKWLNAFTEMGVTPLMLSLSAFPMQNIAPQLNVYGDEIIFDGHIIIRENSDAWVDYRYDLSAKSPFALKVDLEGINEKVLIPYACAFQLILTPNIDPINADVPYLKNRLDQKINDNKLKVNGSLILAALFILLLVNFVVFSWLRSSNDALARRVSMIVQSSDDLDALNAQIMQKDSLVRALGWEGGISKSSLIDQIASLLPPELTWRETTVDPVDLSASQVQKSVVFFNRQIRVEGTSDKIMPVNEWIARIRITHWVKDVQLVSYTYNNELNTGQFSVTISY